MLQVLTIIVDIKLFKRISQLLHDGQELNPISGTALIVCALHTMYSEFLKLITGALERCEAYRPSSLPRTRRSQPLWWISECDAAISRRHDALRKYCTSPVRSGKRGSPAGGLMRRLKGFSGNRSISPSFLSASSSIPRWV